MRLPEPGTIGLVIGQPGTCQIGGGELAGKAGEALKIACGVTVGR